MRILGIDPGTATLGFGVIDCDNDALVCVQAGVITTPAALSLPERLDIIYTEVGQLLHEYRPGKLAVELLYFAANTTTAFSVGQARGVVLLAGAQAALPIIELTPLQVKQAVTGYGRASKRQIQDMVKTLLKLSVIPRPDDAADALAIAICAARYRPELVHAGK